LSSPGSGYGHQWVDTINAVELYFNAKYVGWSEDINGLRVASFDGTPSQEEDDGMIFVARMDDTGSAYLWNTATGEYQPIPALDQYQVLVKGFKIFPFVNMFQFETMRGWYGEVMKIPTTDLATVDVNVDGIAQAVADKIDCTCDCGCGIPIPEPVDDVTTKADILEAIETNYPEDK
jgi:hypothetical protein